MTKVERLHRVRRAVFELEEVVIGVLADAKIEGERQGQDPHGYGLEPNQIARELGLLLPRVPLYGDNRCSLIWGVLDSLFIEGRVGKEGSRAYLIDDVS